MTIIGKLLSIWKYSIEKPAPLVVFDMPCGAKILTVQMQQTTPCIWALVDPSAEMESRSFAIVGTGQERPEHHFGVYIGTFQVNGGHTIVHVFELRDSAKKATN